MSAQTNDFKLPIVSQFYHTLKCNGCKREFKDKEKVFRFSALAPTYIIVGQCCIEKLNRIFDFDPNGSKEPAQIDWSWQWIQTIILHRDNGRCRMNHPDGHWREVPDEDLELEVHHIIPRKDGGTNNWKNLITLCKGCHTKTFKNGYAGIPKLFDEKQMTLLDWNRGKDSFVYPRVLSKP